MEHEFRQAVQGWIESALEQNPELCFDELIHALPGVHPNVVAETLDRSELKIAERRGTARKTSRRRQPWKFPVPHPLDFDWRFTSQTHALMLAKISELAPEGNIVLLGAPTLFRAAQATPLANRCFLIDACSETAAAIPLSSRKNVLLGDLLTDDIPIALCSARVVVADPPWYEEFARAFLWVASRTVEVGGSVFLSTPPVGTRPGIELEWSRTLAFAKGLGLYLQYCEQCLRYESPPFEVNALVAAGHAHVLHEWRPGVLAHFEQRGDALAVEKPSISSKRTEWIERAAVQVRFRLRRMSPQSVKNPLLVPLVEGDVLPTVSRRDPRRDTADVWTSGNRIFACGDTGTLALIIEACDRGYRPDTYVESSVERKLAPAERDRVVTAARQVSDIVARELEEYVLKWEG